jgi:hypothetical protein
MSKKGGYAKRFGMPPLRKRFRVIYTMKRVNATFVFVFLQQNKIKLPNNEKKSTYDNLLPHDVADERPCGKHANTHYQWANC